MLHTVVFNCGDGGKQQRAFDKPKACDEFRFVYDVFRLRHNGNHDNGAKDANGNQEGALQGLCQVPYFRGENAMHGQACTDGAQKQRKDAKNDANGVMPEGVNLSFVFVVLFFHTCIIAWCTGKSNRYLPKKIIFFCWMGVAFFCALFYNK